MEASRDGAYDLSALGWMLFEQLCAGWLERAVGLAPEWWVGSADRHRYALLESGVPDSLADPPLPGPTIVATAWAAHEGPDPEPAIASTLNAAWVAATSGRVNEEPLRSLRGPYEPSREARP